MSTSCQGLAIQIQPRVAEFASHSIVLWTVTPLFLEPDSGGHHHRHLQQPEHQGSLMTTGTKVLLLLSVILLSKIKMNNLESIEPHGEDHTALLKTGTST